MEDRRWVWLVFFMVSLSSLVNEKEPWSIWWIFGISTRRPKSEEFLKIRYTVLPTLLWGHLHCGMLSVTVIKHWQKQIGEGRLYFAFRLQSLLSGYNRGKLRHEPEEGVWSRYAAYWLVPLDCSATFLIQPISSDPGMALFTVDLVILHRLATTKMSHRLTWWMKSFKLILLLPRDV